MPDVTLCTRTGPGVVSGVVRSASLIGTAATVALLAMLSSPFVARGQAPAATAISFAERPFFVGGEYVREGEQKYGGGKYLRKGEGRYMAGQMYVQHFAPDKTTQRWPVVMVHGTAQTGNVFLGTADGRPGWVNDFVANGYEVYLVDQVGRGRSGSATEVYGPYTRVPAEDLEEIVTAQENYDLFPQARLHKQWPGGPGVVGNPSFDRFYASQVESIADDMNTERLNNPALIALLEKIGGAVLLTHSQSGAFGWKVADLRPELVKAHVAVEPAGPPFYDVVFRGGSDWYGDSARPARAWGITRLPLTFDPPASGPPQLAMARQDVADSPNMLRCWLQASPARQLPRLKGIPIVIVTGEGSFRATHDHCTSKFLSQAGVPNAHLRLENENVQGNGHMMMLEKNSSQVAEVMMRWIEKNVK